MTRRSALNIVLLTIDCWRGDHLGVTGATPSPTPHLDKLAAEGSVFEQAITCGGWTRPAMMALFSSVYASRHHGGSLKQLAPELPVVTELVKAQGYETAGFCANLVCGRSGGFHRGFDAFEDVNSDDKRVALLRRARKIRGYNRVFLPLMCRPRIHRFLRRLGVRLDLPEYTASARRLTRSVLDWLRQPHSAPLFLWAHYIDLHWPYRLSRRQHDPDQIAQAWQDRRTYRRVVSSRGRFDPGPETRARWQALYREELLAVDEQIGLLIDRLRRAGLWERTALIVTSDHGEEFFEHGTWAHSWNQLFDEGIHVPLIIRVPGLPAGIRVRQQVSGLDIAPTILDIAGIDPSASMMGASLLPFARDETGGETHHRPEAIVEMLGHRNSYLYRMAVRTLERRYIHDAEHPHSNKLYDRAADQHERHNVYSQDKATARRFDEHRFEHMAPIVPDLLELADDASPFADTDPEVVERLRALGYVE